MVVVVNFEMDLVVMVMLVAKFLHTNLVFITTPPSLAHSAVTVSELCACSWEVTGGVLSKVVHFRTGGI